MNEPRHFSVRAYAALLGRNHNMRRLWLAGFVSMTADWFHRIALHVLIAAFFAENWQASLAGAASPVDEASALLWTTFAFQAQMLPPTIFSPLIGSILDRFSRRTVMIVADAARALMAFPFIFIIRPEYLSLMILLEVPLAVAAGFFDTAQKAMLPDLVERDELVAANGIIQANWGITAGLGALLGGALVLALGPETAFLINAATFVFSMAMVMTVRVEERHLAARRAAAAKGEASEDSGSFMEGVRYVTRRRALVALLSAKPGWALTGGTILALHTVMGSSVFDNWGKPQLGIGLLHGARGAGGLIGALLAPMIFPFFRRHPLKMLATIFLIYGVDYAIISQVGHVLTAALMLVIGTTLSAQLWVAPAVILQQTVPATLRGRVLAADHALSLVFLGVSGLGAYALSELAGVSARTIALLAGAGLFAVGLAYLTAARFIEVDLDGLMEEAALLEEKALRGHPEPAASLAPSLASAIPAAAWMPDDPELAGVSATEAAAEASEAVSEAEPPKAE
jgi:MFS family permease